MPVTDRSGGLLPAALVALLAGVGGAAASYAIAGRTPAFVAAPIAAVLARTLPGIVLTAAILLLGDLGQALNLATAVLLAAVLLGLTAAAGWVAGRRWGRSAGPAVAAALAWLVALALTRSPRGAVAPAAGVGIVLALAESANRIRWSRSGSADVSGRRRVLASLAGALGLGAVAAAVTGDGGGTTVLDRAGGEAPSMGATGGGGDRSTPTETVTGRSEIESMLATAEERSLDVDGLEPLVSGPDFYQVDINAVDPEVSAKDWTLSITGAVESEVALSYEDLLDRTAEHRFSTLRCVGDPLNGRKMDNALWTGVPVADLLAEAGPKGGCECVMLRAADDYFEEFPLAALEPGLLAYGKDGRVLPRGHGYPVRALVPGHWGEVSVKWLTEIKVLKREAKGYWEQRGWHGTGPVNTVAKLHATNYLDGGRAQVGGHAYAGTRGIRRVEVSVDGGESWNGARLSEPLPGEDVWRQWAYEFEPPSDSVDVVVRAVDGTGTLQPRERADAYPSGATGWVSKSLTPY